MKKDLMMLSKLPVGMVFCTNEQSGEYQLLAKLRKSADSIIEGFVAKSTDMNARGLRPFIIESDRPVMVDQTQGI